MLVALPLVRTFLIVKGCSEVDASYFEQLTKYLSETV